MAENFIMNQLMIKSKSIMKLKKLQQDKEMITQIHIFQIINTSKIIISQLQLILVNKKNQMLIQQLFNKLNFAECQELITKCVQFKKIKRNSLRTLQKNSKSFANISMTEYNKVSVKLSDSQLNKLKSAVKNQTGVTLRMGMKIFQLHQE